MRPTSRIGSLVTLCALAVFAFGAGRVHAVVTIYITDNHGVNRYDSQTNALVTLVPESPGADTYTGIAIGPNGNLFAATAGSLPQIWRYDSQTGDQLGTGPFVDYEGTPPTPDPDDVINPQGLAFSALNGNLYVGDISGSTSNVHIYDSTGASVGTLTDDILNQPGDVAFDSGGNLYVVNPGFANVMKSAGGTDPLTPLFGPTLGGLINPVALTVGPDNMLYVVDQSTASILRYTLDGDFDSVFYEDASFQFQPIDADFGDDGLYVVGNDLNGFGMLQRLTFAGALDEVLILPDASLMNPRFLVVASAVPEVGAATMLGAVAVGAGAGLLWRGARRRAE